VLLIEQTPVKGGEITPVAGVYHFESGSEVILTAIPKPGYKFVHWLGDVSDATASNTAVYLDKPKVIVAVFEQTEYGVLAEGGGASTGGGGAGGGGSIGGLMPTALDFRRPGGLSAGGGGGNTQPQPQQGKLVYFVDASDSDTSPEVPEPATGVLLVLGGLFAFARRRAGKLA
jgi:hypothetical protein